MKKVLMIFCIVFGIFTLDTIKVKADEASVYVGTVGDVKAGAEINIVVDLENMHNLYAASFKYEYDNTLLNIESIDINSNIKTDNIYEAYKDTNAAGNTARYAYTNLGEVNGFTGNTNFLVIKAKVLKDGDVNLSKDNLQVELIGRNGDIQDMKYILNTPEKSWTVEKANDETVKYTEVKESNNSHDFNKALGEEAKDSKESKDSNVEEESSKEQQDNKEVTSSGESYKNKDNEDKKDEAAVTNEYDNNEETTKVQEKKSYTSTIVALSITAIIVVLALIQFRKVK